MQRMPHEEVPRLRAYGAPLGMTGDATSRMPQSTAPAARSRRTPAPAVNWIGVASSRGGPMICTPIGRAVSLRAIGATALAQPAPHSSLLHC